jgi:hypothetical protein
MILLMSQLTLTLPDEVATVLAQIGRDSNRGPEDVAREMVERAVALNRLDELRREVRESLGPNSPKTENDVFEQIS